jgi:septal ring factor EnvC (AmiA/AmiB activator)
VKIFDPSPAITLEAPRRRRVPIASTLGVAVCRALAGVMYYQHAAYSTQLAQAHHDLKASRAEVRQLRTSLTSTRGQLDAARSNINRCAASLDAEVSKVAAFSKQAAACEVIREKLHPKG